MNEPTNYRYQWAKVWRFAGLYGWSRTANKVLGRTRWFRLPYFTLNAGVADTSFIGCGQFAFNSLAFFLRKQRGNIFLDAFDTDSKQAATLASFYRFRHVVPTVSDLLANPALKRLFIASSHSSHTPYAVAALSRDIDVYVEKPIAVTREQLVGLLTAYRQSAGRLYAGYNRPFAAAIRRLKPYVVDQPKAGPFSINFVVSGHQIPADHWYRRPEEGSRICGNLGHWIDLMVHVLAWRGLPDWIEVCAVSANQAEPDDNLTITFTTNQHDLISLMLTARSEPFEGVSEHINLQYNNIIAHIHDFRHLTIWQGMHRKRWRFSPKDVGHERATMQPFRTDNRNWREVELSTLLMLQISEQVTAGCLTRRFVVQEEMARLDGDIQIKLSTQPINENFNSGRHPAEFYESGSPASGVDKPPAGGIEARSYGTAL
jgi:predicted dehydrogenase